ncbi:MAG: TlpA disulfide reductase family protein [Candidatus Poribacteria bacterium]
MAALGGCAAQLTTPPEHNYALARHGSYVVASRGVGGHRAETLINGVVDPDEWKTGEGWEAPFVRNVAMTTGRMTLGRARTASGYAYVQIQLKEPRRVNRVVVHALDSDEHPFTGIERGELLVRSPGDSLGVWRTVATIEKGKILVARQIKGSIEARTIFRFPGEDISAVRLQIFETGEAARLPSGGAVRRSIADTVRLLEIEISGPEALDLVNAGPEASAAAEAPARATVGLPAPPFELQDALSERTISLADYRGRVVLLYLFAPFTSLSSMIDLTELDATFRSPGFAILGLSFERAAGRQTRQMMEMYHVDFNVLLADEATVTRYEGVGSMYLVGRDGVILDRFSITRARDMRPLLEAIVGGGDGSEVPDGDR